MAVFDFNLILKKFSGTTSSKNELTTYTYSHNYATHQNAKKEHLSFFSLSWLLAIDSTCPKQKLSVKMEVAAIAHQSGTFLNQWSAMSSFHVNGQNRILYESLLPLAWWKWNDNYLNQLSHCCLSASGAGCIESSWIELLGFDVLLVCLVLICLSEFHLARALLEFASPWYTIVWNQCNCKEGIQSKFNWYSFWIVNFTWRTFYQRPTLVFICPLKEVTFVRWVYWLLANQKDTP